MFARFGFLAVLAIAIGALSLGAGQRAEAADKVVTLTPSSGIVGTVVNATLTGAPPNDPITVIFKIPGDPILATGVTDANGYAEFTFTIPYVAGSGTYPIFFTDFKCSCQVAVDFTVVVGLRTPTPIPTPTTPPTATPTQVPFTPVVTVTPTATATATSTPGVPVAGNTGFTGGSGPNVGVLGLGGLVVMTILAWFIATRGQSNSFAPARVHASGYDAPDYTTDLDFGTLDALRRPATVEPATRTGSRGFGWALSAGAAAIAGIALLKRK